MSTKKRQKKLIATLVEENPTIYGPTDERSTTVRISRKAHVALREMAEASGVSMNDVLDEAIEALRRHKFLEDANRAYAALRQNRPNWKEEMKERNDWDSTLNDGLDE